MCGRCDGSVNISIVISHSTVPTAIQTHKRMAAGLQTKSDKVSEQSTRNGVTINVEEAIVPFPKVRGKLAVGTTCSGSAK